MRICGYQLSNGDYPCDRAIHESEHYCQEHQLKSDLVGALNSIVDLVITCECPQHGSMEIAKLKKARAMINEIKAR